MNARGGAPTLVPNVVRDQLRGGNQTTGGIMEHVESSTTMGRRSEANFRRTDAIRALQSCRDGGLEPAAMEITIAPDGGVTFRVLSGKAATDTTQADAEWSKEIAKLKATSPKGGKGQ